MKTCILVFSGYNQRAVIAFLRTLESNKTFYAVIAASKDDPLFDTLYKKQIFAVRSRTDLDLAEIVKIIYNVKKHVPADKYLIAPSTEALNRFLLQNRTVFEDENTIIPLVDRKTYELISDKYSFGELCNSNGIKTPMQSCRIEETSIPFVAKPKSYFNKQGIVFTPQLIFTEEDKTKFKEHFGDSTHFYYQQYIGGRSFYLLYYFHANGNVYKFSQENYIQQAEGNSIIAAFSSTIHLSEVSARYEALFKSIHFRGMVMVEIKQLGNEHFMIEANPRFWGPSQLFVDAGVNLFEIFLNDYNILKTFSYSMEKKEIIRYFWFGGLVSDQAENKKPTFYNEDTAGPAVEMSLWQKSDIYNRPDTRNIYNKETGQTHYTV